MVAVAGMLLSKSLTCIVLLQWDTLFWPVFALLYCGTVHTDSSSVCVLSLTFIPVQHMAYSKFLLAQQKRKRTVCYCLRIPILLVTKATQELILSAALLKEWLGKGRKLQTYSSPRASIPHKWPTYLCICFLFFS